MARASWPILMRQVAALAPSCVFLLKHLWEVICATCQFVVSRYGSTPASRDGRGFAAARATVSDNSSEALRSSPALRVLVCAQSYMVLVPPFFACSIASVIICSIFSEPRSAQKEAKLHWAQPHQAYDLLEVLKRKCLCVRFDI